MAWSSSVRPKWWAGFVADLKTKHTTIEALNAAWETGFADFEAVMPPKSGSPGLVDYHHFAVQVFDRFYGTLFRQVCEPALGQLLYGPKTSGDPLLHRACTSFSMICWDDGLSDYPQWRVKAMGDVSRRTGKPVFNSELHLYHDTYAYFGSPAKSRYRYFLSALDGEWLSASFAWGQWTKPGAQKIHRVRNPPESKRSSHMLRHAMSIICLAILPTYATAAPKNMTVCGRAPVGAFGVDTLEHVEGAAKLGMTLLFSYSPECARKQLDLHDPLGQAVAKHKMQVMYPLCGRFTQVRLAREINPTDTTIPVVGERADAVMSFPKSGDLMIEGERIEYATRTANTFGGCRRGAGGTQAAPHGAGLLLCDSEALRKEILAGKDSPNLWGYWLVDDNRPREIDSLREMSRIIRLADRDAQGRPNSHVIVMGIGGSSAMANFDVGICDAIGVYPYPYHFGKLDATTRNQMRFIVTRARSLQPDIGLIGIYQAFAYDESPQWKNMPTPEQVREDLLSFYDWGADGVLAYIYHSEGKNKEPQGIDAFPAVRDMVGRLDEEIHAGKIKRTVPLVGKHEWLTILAGPEAKPSPGGQPAYDLDDSAKLASLVKGRPNRLSAEPFVVEGRSYPLKVSFPAWNQADPKSDRWPIAQFAAGDLTTADWSQVGALEQPIYNPGEQTIVVLISLEDTAKGWWQRSVEIPPRVPLLLRVPMDEARLSVDPGHIQRWLLWESDPPVAVEFRLGTPRLAPAGTR